MSPLFVLNSSTVCCSSDKSFSSHKVIFVYLIPFQQWLYDFEIYILTPRTTEGLICSYYRRLKHSLMLQKEKKSCINSRGVNTFEQNEDVYIFLVLPKYHIFSFSTALQKLQKIRTCFPEDKLSSIYSQNHTVIVGKGSNIQKCWKTK